MTASSSNADSRYRVEVTGLIDRGGFSAGYQLKMYRNDKLVWIMDDNGEPEDNSFLRDYDWIKPALDEAYQFGLADGAASVDTRDRE